MASRNKTPIITPFSGVTNLTGKHKDWYNVEYMTILCDMINPKNKLCQNTSLIQEYEEVYLSLELKERLNLIASLLYQYLPRSYVEILGILECLLGDPLPYEEGMFTFGFHLYPVSQFVEVYGGQDIEQSFQFIEKLTMRFTGEWAVRTLANLEEERTLQQMEKWSEHDNFHVRRLASEGMRARLPWGKKIIWVDQSPEKTLPIYQKLRHDSVLYVRRSVANAMGDMIKIKEDLAFETLLQWFNESNTKESLWVIQHAIRTPVKKQVPRFVDLRKQIEVKKAELG